MHNYKIKWNNIFTVVQEFSQKEEKVFVWGAGAKGVTFVNLFDQMQKYISGIIDINPDKQGCYVGITAHKVISAKEALDEYDIGGIIVLNVNYLAEIKECLAKLAPDNKIQLHTIS